MSCHGRGTKATEAPSPCVASIITWIEQVISPEYCPAIADLSPLRSTPSHRPKRKSDHSLVNQSKSRNRSRSKSPTNIHFTKRRKVDPTAVGIGMEENAEASRAGLLTPRSKSDGSSIARESLRTPARSSSTIQSLKSRNNPDAVGQNMTRHGLLQNDKAFQSYPDFQQKIMEIVESTRTSQVSSRSISKFENRHRTYARMNETKMLQNLFPIIMRDGYTLAHGDLKEDEMNALRKDDKLYRDFLDDEQIITTMDTEFVRTLLPIRPASQQFENEITKDLEKQSGMKNPKPDYAYGIKREKFPISFDTYIPIEITALLEIAPGMHHPFFFVEGKADRGSMAEAENQARRAGATLVNAARSLAALVDPQQPKTLGPDETSFVFSATMGPNYIDTWVHWFEEKENETDGCYHMDLIASDTLAMAKNIQGIRQRLHNILEWGANNRYTQQSSLHTKIHEYARKERQSAIEKMKMSKKRKTGVNNSIDDED